MVNREKKNSGGSECSVKSTFLKAVHSNSRWNNKDEFLDVVYWLKQVLSIVIGIAWGVFAVKGFVGIVLFVLVNCGVTYFFYSHFHEIDEDEFGGSLEIQKEGFMVSFSGFLVSWIVFYTGFHF